MSSEEPLVCRDAFYRKLEEHFSAHPLNKPWSREYLQKTIDELTQIKDKTFKKSRRHYELVRRFQLLETADGEIRLISRPYTAYRTSEPARRKPRRPEATSGVDVVLRAVVAYEDVYDKLHDLHVKTGHSRRCKMMTIIRRNYVIPVCCVVAFLNLCRVCADRKKNDSSIWLPNGTEVELLAPTAEDGFNDIGQVDVLDFNHLPDGEYRFLLRYEDLATKFLSLRPLKTNSHDEIVGKLLKIFLIYGAPLILQSCGGGYGLVNAVIKLLLRDWPSWKIVNTHRPSHKAEPHNSFYAMSQETEQLLRKWMREKANPNWSTGCHFVQWQQNNSINITLGRTPFTATFANIPKSGPRMAPPVKVEQDDTSKQPTPRKSRAKATCGEPKGKRKRQDVSVDKETSAKVLNAVQEAINSGLIITWA